MKKLLMLTLMSLILVGCEKQEKVQVITEEKVPTFSLTSDELVQKVITEDYTLTYSKYDGYVYNAIDSSDGDWVDIWSRDNNVYLISRAGSHKVSNLDNNYLHENNIVGDMKISELTVVSKTQDICHADITGSIGEEEMSGTIVYRANDNKLMELDVNTPSKQLVVSNVNYGSYGRPSVPTDSEEMSLTEYIDLLSRFDTAFVGLPKASMGQYTENIDSYMKEEFLMLEVVK